MSSTAGSPPRRRSSAACSSPASGKSDGASPARGAERLSAARTCSWVSTPRARWVWGAPPRRAPLVPPPPVELAAIPEDEAEAPSAQHGVDLQQVAPPLAAAAQRTGGFPRGTEQRARAERRRDVPQIVEDDLGLGKGAQELAAFRRQVAQRSVAEPALRKPPQLLLDRAQGRLRPRARAEIAENGEQGGEPAHRARQVDPRPDLVPAMSLDVHEQEPLAAPRAAGERRGGEQQLVELRADGGADLLLESLGPPGLERDGDGARHPDRIAAA